MGTSDEENTQGPRKRRGTRPSAERGQTTLDFAIGISIFLAVLIFIFLFIPGVLSPFTESTQEETVASNRIADQLAKGMLASPSEPYVLDRYRTVEWLNNSDSSLESDLGLDQNRDNLNVSIQGNLTDDGDGNDILCWKKNTGLVELASGNCDTSSPNPDVPLTRGDTPPSETQLYKTRIRRRGGEVTVGDHKGRFWRVKAARYTLNGVVDL